MNIQFSRYDIQSQIDYIKSLASKAPKKSKHLNRLLLYSHIFPKVKVSQQKIGEKTGSRREHVNVATTEFQEQKLLVKIYDHRKPSTYILHPMFKQPEVRRELAPYLPALKWNPHGFPPLTSNRNVNVVIKDFNGQSVDRTPFIKKYFYKKGMENRDIQVTGNYKDNLKKEDENGGIKYSTNRKGVVKVMSQSENNEIIISAAVAAIAKQLGLSEQQEIRLSKYPDNIVKLAFQRMQGKELQDPFPYLLKICSSELQKQPVKSKVVRLEASPSTQPVSPSFQKKVEEVKKTSPVKLAVMIYEFKKMEKLVNDFIIPPEAWQKIIDTRIRTLIEDYQLEPTQEEGELIALGFIEKEKQRVNIEEVIKPKKVEKISDPVKVDVHIRNIMSNFKQESNTTIEIPPQQPNTHKQENLPTNSNLVEISKPNLDYDLFEEVLD